MDRFLRLVAGLLLVGAFVPLFAGSPDRSRLEIKPVGRTSAVVEITVHQPAYKNVVVQYALDPKAHDNDWHAFIDFKAGVSPQVWKFQVPAVGPKVFFRAFEYEAGPEPIEPPQIPPPPADSK